MFPAKSFLIFLFVLVFTESRANRNQQIIIIDVNEIGQNLIFEISGADERPHPILEYLKKKKRLNRKLTAAALAFPFPFGIVGLHRIYLGCAPYVPVVYIGTLGGIFGLLPLIDCAVILLDKDVEHYSNSTKVFMWVN